MTPPRSHRKSRSARAVTAETLNSATISPTVMRAFCSIVSRILWRRSSVNNRIRSVATWSILNDFMRLATGKQELLVSYEKRRAKGSIGGWEIYSQDANEKSVAPPRIFASGAATSGRLRTARNRATWTEGCRSTLLRRQVPRRAYLNLKSGASGFLVGVGTALNWRAGRYPAQATQGCGGCSGGNP